VVEVDAEVVAGVAVLVAVLAGAVAGQRPGEGDLVFAPGPLHVDQGGAAAVRQVLAGEQAPPLQPSVDAGHGCGVRAGGGHGCDVGDDVGTVGGAGLGDVGEVTGLTADELAGRLLYKACVTALLSTAFGPWGEASCGFPARIRWPRFRRPSTRSSPCLVSAAPGEEHRPHVWQGAELGRGAGEPGSTVHQHVNVARHV
jgi:hypothetical protein